MKNILVMVLSLLMLGGCASEVDLVETNYEFPVIKEDLSKIIEEENLPWSVGEEIEVEEALSYYVKNGNDKNTIKVYSKEDDDSRMVRLDMLSTESELGIESERLDGESIPKMFTMAARIYGLGALSESNKVYNDVVNYMKDRSAKEFGSSIYESKYADYYFSVGLESVGGNYSISYIRIEDKGSYEQYMKQEAKKWAENLSAKLPISDNSSILQLKDAQKEEILLVEGSIVKQSRLPKEKAKVLSSLDENAVKKSISREDYVDAIIANGDDKISVILRINGLGQEEIKESRIHYVYYSPENTVGVVEYMVK